MTASSPGAAGTPGVRSRQAGWRARYQPDRRKSWLNLMAHSPAMLVSAGFVTVVIGAALAAPLIIPYDPEFADPSVRLQGPSADYWLGTDSLGRDVLSRLVYGARISLLVGASVTVISAVLGSIIGLFAGYYRRLDGPIMRVMDGFMAFPGILLAIAIVVSLGPRTSNVILALTLVYVPVVSRLIRGATLVIKELPHVEAARTIGLPDRTILRRYVLANSLSPLIVQCTFIMAYAIIAEASLSFLGASVNPETPTWGNMLRDGQRLLSRAWWIAVFPGSALFLTVLSFNVLGDGLRDALDPRAKERREDGLIR